MSERRQPKPSPAQRSGREHALFATPAFVCVGDDRVAFEVTVDPSRVRSPSDNTQKSRAKKKEENQKYIKDKTNSRSAEKSGRDTAVTADQHNNTTRRSQETREMTSVTPVEVPFTGPQKKITLKTPAEEPLKQPQTPDDSVSSIKPPFPPPPDPNKPRETRPVLPPDPTQVPEASTRPPRSQPLPPSLSADRP
ncbi:mucin-7-like [Penaeus chinensis]|uniref:mucin-7-like n=1 Tax=Penaeus chinensis TaxID=139456 RepID=UPI001FB5B9BE|nr:mucin-7-like [Penaeus chinensis]